MTPLETGESYLEAWSRKDITAIARLIHPDARFKGPMMEATGRDTIVASVERMFPMVKSIEVRSSFDRGAQAIFIYDFVGEPPVGTVRVADLMTFEDGLIKDIELFFDARPFEKPARG